MLEYIYEWIQNIAFYLILITAVIHVIPDSGYKKYIRFFTGLVLILLILNPVLRLFQMEHWVTDIYQSKEYQKQIEKMEEQAEYFENIKLEDILPEGAEPEDIHAGVQSIEVEEIRVDE